MINSTSVMRILDFLLPKETSWQLPIFPQKPGSSMDRFTASQRSWLSMMAARLSYLRTWQFFCCPIMHAPQRGEFGQEWVSEDDTGQPFPLQLFSVTRAEVQRFQMPWYYFGAGAKILINQQALHFPFVKPQNTVELTYYSKAFMEWRGGAGQEDVNIAAGKTAAKRWKSLLSIT